MTGPQGLIYKNHFTLGPNSSILSLGLSHIGHTNLASFLFNSAVLWTIGNYHAKKYGCSKFSKLIGVSILVSSGLGVYEVRKNPSTVISGGMALSATLISYNVFANPKWFAFLKIHPFFLLAALAAYGALENDKACIGGIAAGQLAVFFAL